MFVTAICIVIKSENWHPIVLSACHPEELYGFWKGCVLDGLLIKTYPIGSCSSPAWRSLERCHTWITHLQINTEHFLSWLWIFSFACLEFSLFYSFLLGTNWHYRRDKGQPSSADGRKLRLPWAFEKPGTWAFGGHCACLVWENSCYLLICLWCLWFSRTQDYLLSNHFSPSCLWWRKIFPLYSRKGCLWDVFRYT